MTDSHEREVTTEAWVYAGRRMGDDRKIRHAWKRQDGEFVYFAKYGTKAMIGSRYTVETANGGSIVLGVPEWLERASDEADLATWQAQDSAAATQLARHRAERKAGERRELDAALAPLVKIADGLRTGPERDAFAAYVMRALLARRA